MENQMYYKICGIREDTNTLLKLLRAAEITDNQQMPETYERLVFDASSKAEQIACDIRHVICNASIAKKAEVMQRVAQVQGIMIQDEKTWLKIRLPILLQKKFKNAELLSDPLLYALSEFAMEREIRKLNQAVVCFRHVYDKKLPKRRIRDYDNMEEKEILDVIALFALLDDSGRYCDIFNTVAFDDDDYTEIFVMESAQFLLWLKQYKTG